MHLLGRCFCTAGTEKEEALSGATELLQGSLDWTYHSAVFETCGENVFPPLKYRGEGEPAGTALSNTSSCIGLERGINIFGVR